VLGELLYCCSDGGIVGCYEARTGKEIYRERLGAGSSGFSASPVAIGERIWFCAESGEVFVVKAGKEFEVLATNELGETCMATPAIADGALFFRGRHHLIAVKEREM
jgi:outer membrane protein assembly factor BamB